MKKHLFFLFLLLLFSQSFAAAPDWVKTFGVDSPYSTEEFLTGFAMVNRNEDNSLLKAREISLGDLTGKIETKVYSDITLRESDGTDGYSSSSSMLTRCTVDITVSGVDFDVFEDRTHFYTLAFIPISELLAFYINNASILFLDINSSYNNAQGYINENKSASALSELYDAKKNIINFYEQFSLYTAINPHAGESSFFQDINNLNNLQSFKNLENDISIILEKLEDPYSINFDQAIDKISVILKRQGISGGNINVPPFNFEQTSFSSEFGRYGSSLLQSSLMETLDRSSETLTFRSNYWVQDKLIHMTVLAINEDGEKLAQASVRFPYDSSIDFYELKPQNFEESMIALREFADGALTDGGLNIDIWTNKGRDEDSPVYENGETLQLFMRVNQPSFLQITYHLATGQSVLLEKSFYIGMDKVNRTVKLPYDFEVQPPLGIEQLIVTAYSIEPPEANTILEYIDGEEYEVFSSMTAITEQSRGLRKKQEENTTDVRMGEALINLTTIREE